MIGIIKFPKIEKNKHRPIKKRGKIFRFFDDVIIEGIAKFLGGTLQGLLIVILWIFYAVVGIAILSFAISIPIAVIRFAFGV